MKSQPDQPALDERIFKLALDIARLDSGALARLRRMRSDGPGTAEFWKLALEHGVRTDVAGLRFMALLALLTPKGEPGGKRLHNGRNAWGKALAGSGYPETRLLRFLSTPFAYRADALEAMARWLAAKGHDGVNCVDLACLLWFDDIEHERRLARSYFTELKKTTDKNGTEKKDEAA
jgi:hypothetical protein